MKKSFYRDMAAIALTMGLGACATWDVGSVSGMQTSGSEFNKALHGEYVRLAQLEVDEADWRDGAFFLDRARVAGGGEMLAPQAIDARMLPADKVDEMTAARADLVSALAAGKASKPGPAARAQAGFDCWMQKQEENFQPKDIAGCKAMFTTALELLKAKPMAKPAPKPAPMMAKPGPFLIFFDFDGSAVDDAAMSILREAAAAGNKFGAGVAGLVGHTDLSGANDYNDALSNKRAATAAASLRAAGFSGGIVTEGRGETEPLVPTPDGVREPQNRRVEVSFF